MRKPRNKSYHFHWSTHDWRMLETGDQATKIRSKLIHHSHCTCSTLLDRLRWTRHWTFRLENEDSLNWSFSIVRYTVLYTESGAVWFMNESTGSVEWVQWLRELLNHGTISTRSSMETRLDGLADRVLIPLWHRQFHSLINRTQRNRSIKISERLFVNEWKDEDWVYSKSDVPFLLIPTKLSSGRSIHAFMNSKM